MCKLGIGLVVALCLVMSQGCSAEEPPAVLHYVLVSPGADSGVQLATMNYRPDLVSTAVGADGEQELVVADQTGVLASITGSRETLEDGRARINLTVASAHEVIIMADGLAELEYAVEGFDLIMMGEPLPAGEHRVMIEGRPEASERTNRHRQLRQSTPGDD